MRKIFVISSLACFLIAVTSAIAALEIKATRHDWMPDSQIYLWMAMQDRGVAPNVALQDTRHFMTGELDTGGKGEAYWSLYTEHPPAFWDDQFALFASRPLYPFLSSFLLPRYGPIALKYISGAAYVLTVLALFVTLLILTGPIRAAIGALVFATEQIVIHNSVLALTDQLALFFWVCALGGVLWYQFGNRRESLICICIASVALTLTRPAFFLPLGAASGAFLALRRSSDLKAAAAPFIAAVPGLLLFVIYGATVHGPSVIAQIHWQYVSQEMRHGFGSGHGLLIWYIAAVSKGFGSILLSLSRETGGIALVLIALIGLINSVRRNSGPGLIAVVSVAASAIALLVNPIDVDRQVVLPIAPLIVLLAIAAVEQYAPGKTHAK